MCEGASAFYRDFSGRAKQNNCCPVCDQQLAKVDAFVAKMEKLISSVPDNAETVRNQIKQLKQRKEQELVPMQSVWTELQTLKPVLDSIKTQSKALETEHSDAAAELEEVFLIFKKLKRMRRVNN
jgi:DNA repair exonuclease SbcCD ATPase subunit